MRIVPAAGQLCRGPDSRGGSVFVAFRLALTGARQANIERDTYTRGTIVFRVDISIFFLIFTPNHITVTLRNKIQGLTENSLSFMFKCS